jgi:FkbM family methyltransferase
MSLPPKSTKNNKRDNTMKHSLKKIIPRPVWEYLRKNRLVIRDSITNLGREVCSANYFGFKIFYSRGTTLVEKIRGKNVFEKALCEHILQALPAGPAVMIDVGANIGLISAYVLAKKPDVTIYAFEPGPHQFAYLKKTIEHNAIGDRIIASSLALGEREETLQFVTHSAKDVSKDGFINTGRGEGAKMIDVQVTTLDLWWQENNKPGVSVIKIDTEGAELFILKGGEQFIRAVAPRIYLEIEPMNLKNYPYSAADIFAWFALRDYEVYTLSGEKTNGAVVEGEDTYCAIPKNQLK